MLLQRLPKVNVQRLFGVVLVIKVLSSIASFVFGSPWILGLVVPITMMIAYMVIGHFCREDDVSLERFADSCYYMGFIFTITSIIVCLFDLPNLGAAEGMRNIALRFGAAMVSTVLGMGVRVYLVSFRKDSDDAIRDAEDAVLDATRMFVSQLDSVMASLKQFEVQVTDAAKHTVENVNRQVEALSTQYAQSLSGFYVKVTEENKAAFTTLIDEVRVATGRLADSVDTYSSGMQGNLAGIELKVTEFADAVTKRLEATTFPDDFFARELKAPLDLLKIEAAVLGQSVRAVSTEVEASSGTIAEALKKITSRTKKTEAAMDAVVALSEQHHTIVNNADQQLNSLINLAARLEQVDFSLKEAVQTIGINSIASTELVAKVGSLSTAGSTLQAEIKEAMTSLTAKLEANTTLASGIIQKLESQAGGIHTGMNDVIAKIGAHTESSALVAQRLSEACGINRDVVHHLQGISLSNTEVIASANEAANAASTAVEISKQASQAAIYISQSSDNVITKITQVANQMQEHDVSLRLQTTRLLNAHELVRVVQPENTSTTIDHFSISTAAGPLLSRVSSTDNSVDGISGTAVNDVSDDVDSVATATVVSDADKNVTHVNSASSTNL